MSMIDLLSKPFFKSARFRVGDQVEIIQPDPTSPFYQSFLDQSHHLTPILGTIQKIRDAGIYEFNNQSYYYYHLTPGCSICKPYNLRCPVSFYEHWLKSADCSCPNLLYGHLSKCSYLQSKKP